jgi:hypothetical protein
MRTLCVKIMNQPNHGTVFTVARLCAAALSGEHCSLVISSQAFSFVRNNAAREREFKRRTF